MTDSPNFAKLVPGFEFLQGLMKGAGNGLPNMGQWIAPTIDPEEIDKRIEQLKTVQFWLEQNTRMIGASIQALEVQRMTLSTLKTMNLPMADLGNALKIQMPPAPAPKTAPAPEPERARAPKAKSAPAGADGAGAPGVVDPMQWWGALTKQFGDLATQAVQDMAKESSKVAPRATSATAAAKPEATKTAAKKARKPAARRPPAR